MQLIHVKEKKQVRESAKAGGSASVERCTYDVEGGQEKNKTCQRFSCTLKDGGKARCKNEKVV